MGWVQINAAECGRCWHVWRPRDINVTPKTCPSCKSPYWNTPKRVAQALGMANANAEPPKSVETPREPAASLYRDYRDARGAIKVSPNAPPPEEIIRKLRDSGKLDDYVLTHITESPFGDGDRPALIGSFPPYNNKHPHEQTTCTYGPGCIVCGFPDQVA